jgi:hypothetical protein
MPVILSDKIPRWVQVWTQLDPSKANWIEIAIWMIKSSEALNPDGRDSDDGRVKFYIQGVLPHPSLNSMIIHGAGGVNGAKDLIGMGRHGS